MSVVCSGDSVRYRAWNALTIASMQAFAPRVIRTDRPNRETVNCGTEGCVVLDGNVGKCVSREGDVAIPRRRARHIVRAEVGSALRGHAHIAGPRHQTRTRARMMDCKGRS